MELIDLLAAVDGEMSRTRDRIGRHDAQRGRRFSVPVDELKAREAKLTELRARLFESEIGAGLRPEGAVQGELHPDDVLSQLRAAIKAAGGREKMS